MAEIRELLLQDHMGASLFRLPGWGRLVSRLKLALRHFVVITGASPLGILYRRIYRVHVWYALRVLKKIPHISSIYVARGIASGDIVYGVSDVDLVVFGDWSDAEHAEALNALRRLSRLSPLYDASLWQHAHAITSVRVLYATDFYYQFRFDQGRTEWKLLHGDDFLATLPAVPAERIVPGYYMDIRNWWDTFTKSALGSGVTSRDPIFRNSIAYKTAAEIINKALALDAGFIEHSRKKGMQAALANSSGPDRDYLLRLKQSADAHHIRYPGDIQDDTFRFLLRLLEDFHSKLADAPGFEAVPAVKMYIDAPGEEILLTASAKEHAAEIVQFVKGSWSGYRAAFLLPSISFFNLDDLMLLIELDPLDIPDIRQIRELCRFHTARFPKLRQRVALLLLLKQGGYQLETVGFLELWHLVICPAANPDIFSLLSRPDFVLDGAPRAAFPQPVWTRFASALVDEEIGVRRSAMSKVNTDVTLTSLELIRNLWRQLQIEIIHRSTQTGTAIVPMTPAAIRRVVQSWGVPDTPAFEALQTAYEAELEGTATDVRALIPEFVALFSQLQ